MIILCTTLLVSSSLGTILFSDLKFIEVIGKGGFGMVWKGEWMPGKKVVAIKKVEEIVEREVGCRLSLYTLYSGKIWRFQP